MSAQPKVFRIGSIQNAVITGKRFKARLIEAGVVSYADRRQGVALVRKATIDRCINSFIGTPLTMKHKDIDASNKDRECSENGIVERVYFDPEDGGYWAEGAVNGENARQRIARVGKVSSGYIPTAISYQAGKYNCVPYDYEITAFTGEHVAIEEKPRYTVSPIILNSQNQPTPTNMFKWFRKDNKPNAEADAAAAKLAKEQADAAAETARLNAEAATAEDISGDTEIMVGEEKVKLSDLTAGYSAHKANSFATEGQLPEGASLDVDGVQVPVADLIAAHKLNSQAQSRREAQPKVFKIVNARQESDVTEKPAVVDNDTQEARLARGKLHY